MCHTFSKAPPLNQWCHAHGDKYAFSDEWNCFCWFTESVLIMCHVAAAFINPPGACDAAENSIITMIWQSSQIKQEGGGSAYCWWILLVKDLRRVGLQWPALQPQLSSIISGHLDRMNYSTCNSTFWLLKPFFRQKCHKTFSSSSISVVILQLFFVLCELSIFWFCVSLSEDISFGFMKLWWPFFS